MVVDRSVIGRSTGRKRVVIERGPVLRFADAVGDNNDAYRLEARPLVPPTFPFVMAYWGAFPDVQPEASAPDEDALVDEVLSPLLEDGGLLLHGEQEFDYESPVRVGDVLVGEARVVDVYEKETDSASMTFVVTETQWRHEPSGEPAVRMRCNTLVRRGKKR